MDPVVLNGWSSYFSTMASASATLTGLLFVAVSINLTKILEVKGLAGRAAESLVQLFGVLAMATTFLIPGLYTRTLGILILGIALLVWVVQGYVQGKYVALRTGNPVHWILSRVVQTQLACIPLVVSGVLLLCGSPIALYWTATGIILSLAGGILNAWVLLVEILR
jgi:modulator of FtsH protease